MIDCSFPVLLTILDSLVVRISACHVEGPGSIPGRGEFFLRDAQLELIVFFCWQNLQNICLGP